MATTNPTRSRRTQRGFSFIEILIVMGIISVLVGGVIVAINMWTEKGPEFATRNTVVKVKAHIEDWKRVFEFYPPGDITRIPSIAGTGIKVRAPENNTNLGIEAVYQALFWPGFKGAPTWDSTETANTDEDDLKQSINKFNTTALNEIVDAWGNPLIYFHRDQYVTLFESGAYITLKNGLDVEAKPYKNNDGTFVNPGTFQIWSMGPDQEPNTDDDILSWTKEEE